jgi:hypothetical protein
MSNFLPHLILFNILNVLCTLQYTFQAFCRRPLREVCSHFEYLDNRSGGLGVTWQPVRGDLTAHPWTVTLPWGLVNRQKSLTELVYCMTFAFAMTERADQLHHDNAPNHSTALVQFFFCKTSRHPGLSAPLQPRFDSLRLLAFPKVKIAVERGEICERDCHTVHKLSQRCRTAEWLAPRDCSRMRRKVSSDWLPSYITATLPVLEICKMAGYFPDRPRIFCTNMVILNLKGWGLKPETQLQNPLFYIYVIRPDVG